MREYGNDYRLQFKIRVVMSGSTFYFEIFPMKEHNSLKHCFLNYTITHAVKFITSFTHIHHKVLFPWEVNFTSVHFQ